VKIASMHRAKGTEFSRVIVISAEAGVVPLDWMIESQPEVEHEATRGRERSLFYVACSRARDELIVTWSGRPNPLPAPHGRVSRRRAASTAGVVFEPKICMLAAYLTWHLRRAWAELTYTDEHPPSPDNPGAQQQAGSCSPTGVAGVPQTHSPESG
jgi:ATP-dependent exoDNAse (exonuclease V) beta subunit